MNKYLKLLIITFSLVGYEILLPQNDFSSKFRIELDSNILYVKNEIGQVIFSKTFHAAQEQFIDFNLDGIDEYYVKDCSYDGKYFFYTAYIFSQVDNFKLIDSMYSGLTDPMTIYSDETNSFVLICGQPELDSINILYNPDHFYPSLNCYRYSGEKFYNANEEIYDIFINENELLVEYLDKEYGRFTKSCEITNNLKPIIAAVYLNLLKASEIVIAKQFLNNYYFCKDIDMFSKFILDLL
jgi:hypothetical protein